MKRLFVTLFFITVSLFSLAQNKPVPSYLIMQDFPDSVKNLLVKNINGQDLRFEDVMKSYRGKKIIVDMWASWCRDCISGLPKLKSLITKTGTEKVKYVFISVDKDELKWKAAIKKFDIQGEHYRIESAWNNSLANYIELDWIPRYFVLNEKGAIILPKAIEANQELEKTLALP